jgi:hypothetical protein
VLTAGGGAPGPVKEVNAEIYYPPYLFDPSGAPAARPLLLAAPEVLSLSVDRTFTATVAEGNLIGKVTLVHAGSVTHSTDLEQRFQQLPFTQAGPTLAITAPDNPNYTLPGYYLLFAFNQSGVPSVAKIIKFIR